MPTAASQKYLPPPGFQAWDGGPVTPRASVWSASDAAANAMTLSNGGLTVTPGGAAGISGIQYEDRQENRQGNCMLSLMLQRRPHPAAIMLGLC